MPEASASSRKTKTTTYHDHYPEQAHKLCLLGATDKDLYDFFGICRSTLTSWKKQHADFNTAIIQGKKAADMEVAASLYAATVDRVITCKQAIKCKEIYYDENGKRVEKERIEIVDVDKHIPADFRSQQFWLKNRNPKQWSDKYDDGDDSPDKSVTLNLGIGLDPHEAAH